MPTEEDAKRLLLTILTAMDLPSWRANYAALQVLSSAMQTAVAAERERCAVQADLVAANYRENNVLHGENEPFACFRSRAAGADAVARRIREPAKG